MNSICADSFNFQSMMQTVHKVERTPYLIKTWAFGLVLYRDFYIARQKTAQIATHIRQAKSDNYLEYIDEILSILEKIRIINSKLNILRFPLFVQRIALDVEDELSSLLEDLYIASDSEIKKLSQELEALLS